MLLAVIKNASGNALMMIHFGRPRKTSVSSSSRLTITTQAMDPSSTTPTSFSPV